MEIDPDEKILPSVIAVRDRETEKPSGITFGEMLDEFMDAPKKVGPRDHGTASIESKSEVQLKDFQARGKNPVIERAERMLDILGEYQRKLADPAFTLRDVSPLVQQLETCNIGLVPEMDALADGDELKDILNQVIIASVVEVVRFNRGDYVNP